MTWNYRIVRENIGTKKEPLYYYGIYEVYYNNRGNPTYWSADVQKAESYESAKDLKGVFSMMKQAFGRGVLEIKGIKNKKLVPIDVQHDKNN